MEETDSSTKNVVKPTRLSSPVWRFKIVKTVALVTVWACLGMMHALGSPTLPILRDRLHTTMEDLSLAFGFRNFGALIGSILFGMMADRYRVWSDLTMAATIVVSAAPTILVPHLPNLYALGVNSFVSGLGQGGLESVGTAMVQWMWSHKSDASLHALHLGYPIGTCLAPLIAMNFLGPDRNDTINTTSSCGQNSTCADEDHIEVPYGIVGAISCIVGLSFAVLAFVGPPKSVIYHGTGKASFIQVFSPKSCRTVGSTCYTVAVLVLVCVFYVFLNAKDGSLSTFVFAFAIESELKFKKKEAALLDTVYRVVEIFGRAVAIPLAHYLPIQPLIFASVFSNAVFTTCLALLGTRSKANLWAFACLFKLTAAPVWPSGMAWVSKYLDFSAMVAATIQVVLGVTGYLFDWLGGHLYDLSPQWFIYYGMSCSFVLVVVLSCMQLVASCCRKVTEVEGPGERGQGSKSSSEDGETSSLMHHKVT